MKQVIIYTDGACSGNPGPGGWCAVLTCGEHRKIVCGSETLTTNNRMELWAAIYGLQALKFPCEVMLYSDSAYMINALNNGWLDKWKTNGWKKSDKTHVENVDLWKEIIELSKIHNVTWIKVSGHSGNAENELCDAKAREMAGSKH